ncbi:unnamed protein product [Arctogadus glacialis]
MEDEEKQQDDNNVLAEPTTQHRTERSRCSGPGSIFQIKRQRKQKDNTAWFLLTNKKTQASFCGHNLALFARGLTDEHHRVHWRSWRHSLRCDPSTSNTKTGLPLCCLRNDLILGGIDCPPRPAPLQRSERGLRRHARLTKNNTRVSAVGGTSAPIPGDPP